MASVKWAWISDWLYRFVLPPYFALHSGAMLIYFVSHQLVGIDARIYSAAASAWLHGGNPWAVIVDNYRFAAPPPTLLAFAPFAALGQSLSSVVWVGGSVAAAVLIVRRLQLRWWWILFPPLVNGILAGNADVLVVLLVLHGGAITGATAAFLKVYALLPLAGERHSRAIVTTAVLLLVSAPVLPWGQYLAQLRGVIDTLERQSNGISAYGTYWLMIGVLLALLRLGIRRAGWLAVPSLWPSTQLHYSTLVLPALARPSSSRFALLVAAFLFAPEVRWLPAVATMALAIDQIVESLAARQSTRRGPRPKDPRPTP